MVVEGMEDERGYVLVDFSPEEIHIRAVNAETGEILDDFTMRHS